MPGSTTQFLRRWKVPHLWARLRRAATWMALLQYVVLCSGLPLPVGAAMSPAIDADSRPFPCRDHRCGCRTEEQCWKSCCCYSPAEKLAWAKANGVTVPEYADVAASAHQPCRVSADDEPPQRACCRAKACSATSAELSAGSASRPTEKSAATSPESKSTMQWVVLIEAQRCNGGDGATTWLSVPISLPVVMLSSAFKFGAAVQSLNLLAEPSWVSVSIAPPSPPPRIA